MHVWQTSTTITTYARPPQRQALFGYNIKFLTETEVINMKVSSWQGNQSQQNLFRERKEALLVFVFCLFGTVVVKVKYKTCFISYSLFRVSHPASNHHQQVFNLTDRSTQNHQRFTTNKFKTFSPSNFLPHRKKYIFCLGSFKGQLTNCETNCMTPLKSSTILFFFHNCSWNLSFCFLYRCVLIYLCFHSA